MKKKLTMEDHRRLARHLRNIRAEISAIREVISGYHLISSVGTWMFGVDNKLRAMKSALDSIMRRDHLSDVGASTDVYYGPAKTRDKP